MTVLGARAARVLDASDERAVRQLLDTDPVATCMVAGRVETHGVDPASLKTFDDFDAALAKLRENEVDIVFTDLEMPRMDGYDLIREIRRREDGERRVPAVALTSFTRQQEPLGLGHEVWCAREIVGNEPFALLLPDVPFTLETLRIIAPYALGLAVVGLLESLMTATLVDDLTGTRSSKTRESVGQGVANVVTGSTFNLTVTALDASTGAQRWDRDRAIAYFRANSSVSDTDIAREVDRYFNWPGQATSYMVGQLKISELRDKAKAALGAKYDPRKFHDAILLSGSMPLTALENVVDLYIAKAKG